MVVQRVGGRGVAGPVARGAADAAVDDEFGRVRGHFGGEVVLDHPVRGFGEPGLAAEFGAARGGDLAGRVVAVGHGGTCWCVLAGIIASGAGAPPLRSGRGDGVRGVWGAGGWWCGARGGHSPRRCSPPSTAAQERGGWEGGAL